MVIFLDNFQLKKINMRPENIHNDNLLILIVRCIEMYTILENIYRYLTREPGLLTTIHLKPYTAIGGEGTK